MTDKLLRALAFDGQVKVYVIDAKNTVEEARRRHDTWRTATAALGRTLIGTALLAANLKGNDQITADIIGEGPLGRILATSDAKMNLRGFVNNPQVALDSNEEGKIDVKGA
ncbi:MAG: Hsp33 family molecular chaperone HslO, partial [Ruoffia tabacinasalis]